MSITFSEQKEFDTRQLQDLFPSVGWSSGNYRQLVSMMLDQYESYARKVLIAYDAEVGFYEKCGFELGGGKTPMFVTHLTT